MKYYVIKSTSQHIPTSGNKAGQLCTLVSYVRGYVITKKVYFVESTLHLEDAIKLTYKQALNLAKTKKTFEIIPAP